MKTQILTTILLMQFFCCCRAATLELPEIPVPKLTVTEVIAIAQQHRAINSTNRVLVSVDWHKASDYFPPFSDGTEWSPGNDHPDDYSWFLTYVCRDERLAKAWNSKHRFNSVLVIRIKDDGQIGLYIGART
jgi:hypothetical protein